MGRISAKKERKGLNKKERREEGEKVTSEKKTKNIRGKANGRNERTKK